MLSILMLCASLCEMNSLCYLFGDVMVGSVTELECGMWIALVFGIAIQGSQTSRSLNCELYEVYTGSSMMNIDVFRL